MTEQEEADRAFETQARLDLQDIRSLQKSEPFNRYFQRRITEIRDKVAEAFRHGKVDPQERETLKRILDELDPIVNLLTAEEANILSELERRR